MGMGLRRWPVPWLRLRPRGLRARLQWLVTAVTLVTVTALGVHTVATESELALDGARHQAGALARSVALGSLNALLTDQLDQIEQTLLREAEYPGVVAIHLLDVRGAIVGHAAGEPAGRARLVFEPPVSRLALPTDERPAIELQRRPSPGRLVAWHPVASGQLLGWARVEMQLDMLDALRDQVLWRTLAAAALALLGSAVLLQWLLRKPLRALDEARRFAVNLAQADGRRLAVAPGGPAEVVELGQALNDAAARLAQQGETIAAKVAELGRQRAALQDSHLQLASMFALSPDGLVSFDTAGRVRYANPAFGRLTGLQPDTVCGWPQPELEAQLRALCAEPAAWPGLAPYFAAGASAPDGQPGLPAPLLRLAAPRPAVLAVLGRQAHPAEAGDDHVTRLLYLRDVTHETEVDRMKSEFLSTAAHELRTPLASIHGFAELLCTRSFPDERRAQMLAAVHRNSGVMVHILNNLLDLSRIEARRGADFQREPGDLGALVAQTLADRVPPPGREPPVLLAAGAPLPACFDAGKIAQVLGNLVGNAYKYSPGGGAVRVRLLRDVAPARAGRVGFEVSDSGIGMTPEQVRQVFDRFYRADPSGTILGTGLGMSIVKEIVDLHGGEVAVASQPGQGTAVCVWLPVAG